MTLSSLSLTQRTTPQEAFDTDKVRTLIAEYLGIDPKRVTDEAHFSDEFGMDRYDRLELMILIEDAFTGVEFTDDDGDQIGDDQRDDGGDMGLDLARGDQGEQRDDRDSRRDR